MSIKLDPYAIIGDMRAYSEDLRKKIVSVIEHGMHVQSSSCAPVRRKPLIGQALLENRQERRVA